MEVAASCRLFASPLSSPHQYFLFCVREDATWTCTCGVESRVWSCNNYHTSAEAFRCVGGRVGDQAVAVGRCVVGIVDRRVDIRSTIGTMVMLLFRRQALDPALMI
jgi:hypothetical protein